MLVGLYWSGWRGRRRWRRARRATPALAAVGAGDLGAVDWVVTGDPLFSLHSTSSSAEDLGRSAAVAMPTRSRSSSSRLVKRPVLVGGVAGLAIARTLAPRRAVVPLVLLVGGIGTFVLVGVAGAVGHQALPGRAGADGDGVRGGRARRLDDARARARVRTGWMAAAAAARAVRRRLHGARTSKLTASTPSSASAATHASLVRVLDDPEVRAGAALRAADAAQPQADARLRWLADLPRRPRDRAQRPERRRSRRRGVALYVTAASRSSSRRSRRQRPALDPGAAAGLRARRDERYYTAYVALLSRRWLLVALASRVARARARSVAAAVGLRTACRTSTTPTRTRTSCRGAIGMFGHGCDPDYFVNPPAYTYLLHIALRAAVRRPRGVSHAFATDPGGVFAVARVSRRCSARRPSGCCAWRARGCFDRARRRWSRRRCWRSPSCPSSTRIWRSTTCRRSAPRVPRAGRRRPACSRAGGCRDYVLAGVGDRPRVRDQVHGRDRALPLVARRGGRAVDRAPAPRARGLALAGVLALAAFVDRQSVRAAGLERVPRRPGAPVRRPPATAAASSGSRRAAGSSTTSGRSPGGSAGCRCVAAARRRGRAAVRDRRLTRCCARRRSLFVLFMGTQERFFARWLLPVFPIAVPAGRSARGGARCWLRARPALRPVAAAARRAVRAGRRLLDPQRPSCSRATTRASWPATGWSPTSRSGSKVVVEPVAPDAWARTPERARGTGNGNRWSKWPTTRRATRRAPGVGGQDELNLEDYERTLCPALIGALRCAAATAGS